MKLYEALTKTTKLLNITESEKRKKQLIKELIRYEKNLPTLKDWKKPTTRIDSTNGNILTLISKSKKEEDWLILTYIPNFTSGVCLVSKNNSLSSEEKEHLVEALNAWV